MLVIDTVVVPDELLRQGFCCNLAACKGACCVQGDGGAPLTHAEVELLDDLYPTLKPHLAPAGVAVLEQHRSLRADDGSWETPLVNGQECAYVVFAANGTAECGIERAWKAGKVPFRKPVSCHLYPLRVSEQNGFTWLFYHRWNICKPAVKQGASLRLPLYVFLKEALIRAFGAEFYAALEAAAADRAQPSRPNA